MIYIAFLMTVIEAVSMIPLIFAFVESGKMLGGEWYSLTLLVLHGISILFLLLLLLKKKNLKKIGKYGFIGAQLMLAILSIKTGSYMDLYNGLIYNALAIVLILWKCGDGFEVN